MRDDDFVFPEGWIECSGRLRAKKTAGGRTQLIWDEGNGLYITTDSKLKAPLKQVVEEAERLFALDRQREGSGLAERPFRNSASERGADRPLPRPDPSLSEGVRKYWAIYANRDGDYVAKQIGEYRTPEGAGKAFRTGHTGIGGHALLTDDMYARLRDYIAENFPGFREI